MKILKAVEQYRANLQKNNENNINDIVGLVVASYGFDVHVAPAFNGEVLDFSQIVVCDAVQSLGRIVVGDVVIVRKQPTGNEVLSVSKRANLLQRLGSYQKLKTHCANIDQLIIVSAAAPSVGFYLMDAMIISSIRQGITPVLLVNKSDINGFTEWQQRVQNYYQSLALEIVCTSAETGEGIEQLLQVLKSKLSCIMGVSGIGKSSLLNALIAEEIAPTQSLSDYSKQGQHTTSNSIVYSLPNSGLLIDTPGVKAFQLLDYQQFTVAYPDVAELAKNCRFDNCQHLNEPSCAVKTAVLNSQIGEERLVAFHYFSQLLLAKCNNINSK